MTSISLLLTAAGPAGATGSLDRLRAVSQHAQERAGGVPAHLWAGVAVAALVTALIAGAAYWALKRPKT